MTSKLPILWSYEDDDDEDGDDQEQDDMVDENSLPSQRTHHLITPTPGGGEWVSTPGYFCNHQKFTRGSSSNAVIWLCWPSIQLFICWNLSPFVSYLGQMFYFAPAAALFWCFCRCQQIWIGLALEQLMTAISIIKEFLWRRKTHHLNFWWNRFWIVNNSIKLWLRLEKKIYCQVGIGIACFQNSCVEETKKQKFRWKKKNGFKQKHSTFAEKRS